MLTVDSITRSEGFTGVSRARPPRALFPVDPGEEELARETSAYPKLTSGRSGVVVEMITGAGLPCSFAYCVRRAGSSITIGKYRLRF